MIINYNVFRPINLIISIQKQVSTLKMKKSHPRREAALKPRQCWISQRNTSLNLEEKLWMTFTLKFSLKARLIFCRKVCLALKRTNSFLTYSFVDYMLSELTLGPTEHDSQVLHWKQMMEQPGERIFLWHKMYVCQ